MKRNLRADFKVQAVKETKEELKKTGVHLAHLLDSKISEEPMRNPLLVGGASVASLQFNVLGKVSQGLHVAP